MDEVWVFNGSGSTFPSGVFRSKEEAEGWIRSERLSGTLTKYPVGVSVYSWAVSKGYFVPKREEHASPEFIGKFSSASQEHYHYEEIEREF
jgi:hypothetical protein